MKKLLSLLLALMMGLGCAAFAETTADYAMYWVLTGVEVAGMQVEPGVLGMDAYMELYEDGTCLLAAVDATQDGVWAVTESGITTTDANGVVDVYTYVDGMLVCEQDGIKLIFSPESYTLPLSGLTLADFEGDWDFGYVEIGNVSYTPEELGMDMALSIRGGRGVFSATYLTESGTPTETFAGSCEIEEIPDFGTALYLLFENEAGETEGGMLLLRFDNDELVWYMDDDGVTVCYCFILDTLATE